MRAIDADRLLSKRMKSKYYHLPNGDVAIPIIDIENAPTIEPKTYDDAVKTIADASFTGGDGLDYVETLVALNAIRGMKREEGEWKPYTYVASDDWYQDKETRYRCSKCGAGATNKSNFCPGCGADMRKTERTEE